MTQQETPIQLDSKKYVAFCDILGFSAMVLRDFDGTVETYKRFTDQIESVLEHSESVQITVYSDAILIVSDDLGPVLTAVQSAWFFALSCDLMLRGGVSYGRYHCEQRRNNMLVVSDALVRAVRIEGSVSVPVVALDDTIHIPDEYWAPYFVEGALVSPILWFEGRPIVNPFNRYWFQSAMVRSSQLAEATEDAGHKLKYEWFGNLWSAVNERECLAPDGVFEKLLLNGALVINHGG